MVVFFFALLPLPWEKEGTKTFNVNKSKTTNVLHGVGLSSSSLSSSSLFFFSLFVFGVFTVPGVGV